MVATDDREVEITNALIDAGKSTRGGWSKRQLALLGVEWPPQQGWKERVIGCVISQEDAELFVKLKT
jgi:hypothetical protein